MITEIQSKGLYSTWLFLPEIDTLFDCGEGLASHLRARIFGIQRIIISHDHTDHIAGLDTFINARNLAAGKQDKPITIYHPKKVPNLKEFKSYILKTQPNLGFKIHWKELEPNMNIDIGKGKKIHAFKVEHGRADAYGFSVIEPRERLKPEYNHLGQTELTRMKRDGIDIQEPYDKKLWVYTGDAWKVPLKKVQDTDYLYIDCTFLKPDDRTSNKEENQNPAIPKKEQIPTHAHIGEVSNFVIEANVQKRSHLIHISPRYKAKDIENAQRLLPPKCTIIPPGKVTLINPHVNQTPAKSPGKPQKQNPKTLEP